MTCLGRLKEVVNIGHTNVSREEFEKYLDSLGKTTFE